MTTEEKQEEEEHSWNLRGTRIYETSVCIAFKKLVSHHKPVT